MFEEIGLPHKHVDKGDGYKFVDMSSVQEGNQALTEHERKILEDSRKNIADFVETREWEWNVKFFGIVDYTGLPEIKRIWATDNCVDLTYANVMFNAPDGYMHWYIVRSHPDSPLG